MLLYDMVDHDILFRVLMDKGLPLPVLQLLLSWYSLQQMCVHWGDCFSDPFGVSNVVWQGSIYSPALFAVYLDGLLEEVVLVVLGDDHLQVHFVMLTILFYWLPAHQQ